MSYLPLSKEDRLAAVDKIARKSPPLHPGRPTTCGKCGTTTAPLYVTGQGGYLVCDYCDAGPRPE